MQPTLLLEGMLLRALCLCFRSRRPRLGSLLKLGELGVRVSGVRGESPKQHFDLRHYRGWNHSFASGLTGISSILCLCYITG